MNHSKLHILILYIMNNMFCIQRKIVTEDAIWLNLLTFMNEDHFIYYRDMEIVFFKVLHILYIPWDFLCCYVKKTFSWCAMQAKYEVAVNRGTRVDIVYLLPTLYRLQEQGARVLLWENKIYKHYNTRMLMYQKFCVPFCYFNGWWRNNFFIIWKLGIMR